MTRSQTSANGKRKRSPSPPASKDVFERTPLTCLYVQGLDKDQIWAQLELRAQNVCKMLEYALDGNEEPTKYGITSTTDNLEQNSSEEEEEEDSDLTYVESDNDSEAEEGSRGSSDGVLEEGVTGLRDPSVDSDREEEALVGDSRVSSSASALGTKDDHSGLDDGFFNLEEFNAETEEAEAAFVSNGALNADSDDIASDDDIDYFASVDGQLHADDDHGMSIAYSVIVPSHFPDPIRTTLCELF